jgi:predicted RNA methylase
VLTSYGHTVITNDIVERDFKLDHTVDFLNETIPLKSKPHMVITNPPFKYAKEFIEKSLEYADIVIVIARLDLLESKKRKDLNQNHLAHVFVHTDRARFAKNGDDSRFEMGTAMSTAWFVYTKNKQKAARIEIV